MSRNVFGKIDAGNEQISAKRFILEIRCCDLNYMLFFYKHSVFQSEARICLSFSQIEPQNMLILEHSKGKI